MSGRCGILGMGKGVSAGLNREVERHRILDSFDVFSVPLEEREWVLEALDDPTWDWFTRCDGCTAVSEAYWPTIYFPPCLRHDYDWQTKGGDIEASKRFYRLNRAYRMSPLRAATRALGVTLSWYGWNKWRWRPASICGAGSSECSR